jgi:hypothetical protein
MPKAVADLRILDFRNIKAAPVRNLSAALACAGELIHENFLVSVLMSQDERANLAVVPVVGQYNLLPLEDRAVKELKCQTKPCPHQNAFD